MKCADCSYLPYSLPLLLPLHIGTTSLTRREGVILTITDDLGNTGIGEIAPLPGLHTESLASVIDSINRLLPLLIGRELPGDEAGIASFARSLLPDSSLPSLRAGFEMALLDLLWKQNASSGTSGAIRIPLNALITGNMQDPVAQALAYVNAGYSSLKLKVGRNPVNEDIGVVDAIRAAVAGRALLRLDANRGWSLEQAVAFGRSVGPEGIQYIEEPVVDGGFSNEFHAATGIPVALDETLVSTTFSATALHPGIGALILKPAILGSITHTMELIRLAKTHGIPAVLSSSFESVAGLSFYAKLAFRHGLSGHAHGLDTWRWFSGESDEGLRVEGGCMVVA